MHADLMEYLIPWLDNLRMKGSDFKLRQLTLSLAAGNYQLIQLSKFKVTIQESKMESAVLRKSTKYQILYEVGVCCDYVYLGMLLFASVNQSDMQKFNIDKYSTIISLQRLCLIYYMSFLDLKTFIYSIITSSSLDIKQLIEKYLGLENYY